MEKRDYSKKELAIMCNPGMSVRNACQKFRRDLYGNEEVMSRLRKFGYKKTRKILAYWQAKLIVDKIYTDIID